MSSATVAAWLAYIIFVVLVAVGLIAGELRVRVLAIVLAVCVAARLALSYTAYESAFPSVVAIADIALVFIVFKGDVRF